MRRSEKYLSLLLVTFIVTVNALTACGRIPPTDTGTADTADPSNLSAPVSNPVQEVRALREAHAIQLKLAVKMVQSENGKDSGALKVSSGSTASALKQKTEESYADPSESQAGTAGPGKKDRTDAADPVQNLPGTATMEESRQEYEHPSVEYVPMTCFENSVIEQPAMTVASPETPETEKPEQSAGDESDNSCYQEIAEAPVSQTPQHTHDYVISCVAPTCTCGGYTVYACSCGYSFTEEGTEALGHDWASHTENALVRQEPHEICCDCGLDLTANGITGSAIADHSKNHVLTEDNASGRTLSVLVDVCEEVTSYICTRCGASK